MTWFFFLNVGAKREITILNQGVWEDLDVTHREKSQKGKKAGLGKDDKFLLDILRSYISEESKLFRTSSCRSGTLLFWKDETTIEF